MIAHIDTSALEIVARLAEVYGRMLAGECAAVMRARNGDELTAPDIVTATQVLSPGRLADAVRTMWSHI